MENVSKIALLPMFQVINCMFFVCFLNVLYDTFIKQFHDVNIMSAGLCALLHLYNNFMMFNFMVARLCSLSLSLSCVLCVTSVYVCKCACQCVCVCV